MSASPEQRARYARRKWAADHIGATMTPETALQPLAMHGPSRPTVADLAVCVAATDVIADGEAVDAYVILSAAVRAAVAS